MSLAMLGTPSQFLYQREISKIDIYLLLLKPIDKN